MNFFTIQYWFSYYPEAFLPWAAKIVFFYLSLVFLVGVLFRYFAAKKKDRFVKKLMLQIYFLLVVYAVVGFFLLFFTQQEIPIFGARLWYVLLDIGAVVWFLFIIRRYKKTVPELRKKAKERAEFEKYIP